MTIAGEDNKAREIPFLGKSFAIDIENGTTGWLRLDTGIRDWKPYPLNSDPPPSPGPNYKRGFFVLLYAPKLLGNPEAFEMCSATDAHMSFCERLFNEAEGQFGKGNVPIVKLVSAEVLKFARGKSRELKFEITKWVPRPAAIIEALAKLKTSTNKPERSADIDDDDFDDADNDADVEDNNDDDETPAPKEKPKKTAAKKPKAEKKSDILDDEIPY
jgi:hypothetical protein